MSDALDPAAALQAAFDASFAAALSETTAAHDEPLLLLNIDGDPFAVRVTDLAGFERMRRPLPVPRAVAHLLGLAGLRGRLIPVFSLAAVLGYRREASEAWMLLAGASETLGLAFGRFEGLVPLSRDAAQPLAQPLAGGHVRAQVRAGDAVRGLVDIASVRRQIQQQAGLIEPAKER